jgi:alpha-L-fucosidase
MKTGKWIVGALLMGLIVSNVASAETPAERDARMKWWREARFGMFIHWGLYAVPAGKWEGKAVPSIGEWIMNNANIPVDRYEKLTREFNPVKFDAAAWVRTAKAAGVKYIVITSKHHDGFCLFDSKVTKYDVVDATPYGKDLLKPLADECRKQGVTFCTYYSIMDWHHPAQYRANEKSYNPTKIREGRKAEYVEYMKAQLKELIDQYDVAVMWFDGEWLPWWTEEDGRDLYAYLRKLKPSLVINNRIGTGRKGMEGLSKGDREYAGDFGTPEQQIPATGLPGVDWESCMTMNDTWGFKSDDHNWKSAETLVRNLVDTSAKGGNYLLNVGPTAEGEIPAASVERLGKMGQWMAKNSESIYATQASPIGLPAWGRATRKGNKLYLHVFQWPKDGKLTVANLPGKPTAASLLACGTKLTLSADDKQAVITVPAEAPDAIDAVIALDVAE